MTRGESSTGGQSNGQNALENLVGMTGVANVVEELIGRELTLSEWDGLEGQLAQGVGEEAAVKSMVETCAQTPSVEIYDVEVFGNNELDEVMAEVRTMGGEASGQLSGHALILGDPKEGGPSLLEDLMALGLTVDGVKDPRSLVRPIPEISGLTERPNYIFVSEECCADARGDFCQQLLARGVPGETALILIDQDLDLCDRWGDWPLAGVLSMPIELAGLQLALDQLISK